MRSQVILHVGRHKTGTSAIQRMLSDNESALGRYGIRYARTGRRNGAIAHHEIARACSTEDGSAVATFRDGIASELRHFPILLISSEAFQNLREPGCVGGLFPHGTRIRVVIYLREYVSYLATSYAQRVQNSMLPGSFREYSSAISINYSTFVAKWERAAEHVDVRLYDRKALVGQDAAEDFLSALNVPSSDFRNVRAERNPSIGGNLLFAKHILNRHGSVTPSKGVYARLLEVARDKDRFPPGFWVDERLEQEIRNAGRDNNQVLEQRFGSIDTPSFVSAPRTPNSDTIYADLEFLSSIPELSSLRDIAPGLEHDDFRQLGRF